MISNKGKKFLFILIYALSVLSVVLSPIVGSILVFAATGLFAVSVFLLPKSYCYGLLFGLFPFANIFKLGPDSMSFLTICEIILLVAVFAEMLIKSRFIRGRVLVLIYALTFTVLHIILFSSEIDYLSIIKLVVRVLLVACYLKTDISKEERETSIKMIAYCLSVSMLLMMILSQIESYMATVSDYLRVVEYDSVGSLIRNGGLLDDPNYCSLAIMVSIAFITVLYYYRKVRFEYWLLVVPLYLLGFTTYSKSYFLTSSAFIILLILLVLFPKHKLLAIVLSIAAVFAVLAILSGQITVINKILLRFTAQEVTTGRDQLNHTYINYIFGDMKTLFFGEGFDAEAISGSNNVHNLYIEMLFKLGIIGSLFFVVTVISCFTRKTTKCKVVNYIPLIIVAVMYMALAGMDSYGLFYYILLVGISLLYVRDQQYYYRGSYNAKRLNA